MQTSDQGIATLKMEEGVVLRAYLCPAGKWTIGYGLTAASGVVTPKPGMVITAQEADDLLQQALAKNYEPAVSRAMERLMMPIAQHEFDAGVLFHFHTGAIAKASWVVLWKKGADRQSIRFAFTAWNKSKGKFLPSLLARREREFRILADGVYCIDRQITSTPNSRDKTKWAVRVDAFQQYQISQKIQSLGYEGSMLDQVKAFQKDHGLTVDGIIGPATLSTLQRIVDARGKATTAGLVTGIATISVTNGLTDQITNIPHSGAALAAVTGFWLLSALWRYRDVTAGWIARLHRVFANHPL